MQRHTPGQVIAKLRQAEADLAQGHTLAQVCQRLGVSEQSRSVACGSSVCTHFRRG
jgi:hypothetical protein